MISENSKAWWVNGLLWALAVMAAVTVVTWGMRAVFIWTSGALASTTGFEEFSLYNIWKVVNGHPLYEWPQKENYALTFYNYLFYYVYALPLKFLGLAQGDLVPWARTFTTAFAALGVWAQIHICRQIHGPARSQTVSLLFFLVAFITWFGTGFNSWSINTARPDVGASTFAALGLACYIARRNSWPGLVLASFLFFLGWSMKQSVVFILAGCLGHALLAPGRLRNFPALLLPFLSGVALVMLAGGEIYRYSTLKVPTLFELYPEQGVQLFVKGVIPNFFMWGLALVALFHWGRSLKNLPAKTWLGKTEQGLGEPVSIVVLALFPTIFFGIIALCKLGSSTNMIFEGFLIASILASLAAARLIDDERSGIRHPLLGGAAVLAVASMILLPVVQIAGTLSGKSYIEWRGTNLGNLVKLNKEEMKVRTDFVQYLQNLPKPLFTRDAMFCLPWYASENRHPAFLIDFQFYQMARKHHVLEGDGAGEWIKRHYFKSLVLWSGDDFYKIAIQSGYRAEPLPAEFRTMPNEFAQPVNLELLVLPES